MKFRTEIKIPHYPIPLNYHSKIFGLGSCFVVNIKEKLDFYKFQNKINAFGTVFNPYSITNIVKRVVKQDFFTEKDLFFHENLWKSYELHSQFNSIEKDEFLKNINQKIKENNAFLKQTNFVIFTFGTAWVYVLKENKKIVSNCHKVPQKYFDKRLLEINEITNEISSAIEFIKSINPDIKFLLTISPVRHLKDGFTENQRSKSRLIEAVHQVVDNEQMFYFPSYEILMDDLRDYRFYANDLLHPNEQAVEYIWEKFKDSLIDKTIFPIMQEVEQINKQLAHRNFQRNQFVEPKLLKKIKILQDKLPWVEF